MGALNDISFLMAFAPFAALAFTSLFDRGNENE